MPHVVDPRTHVEFACADCGADLTSEERYDAPDRDGRCDECHAAHCEALDEQRARARAALERDEDWTVEARRDYHADVLPRAGRAS